jgi:hypothetical protein
LEQGGSYKAQAVPQRLLESIRFLEKCDEQVTDEGGQDLNPDRVFGPPQELLDPQMLLDPFEE